MARVKLPNACSRYGADMGRREYLPADSTVSAKVSLQHVGLDSGGYDSGGAYWGAPDTLYIAEYTPGVDDSDAYPYGVLRLFVRADNREQAKSKIRARFPNLRFYR